MSQINKEAMEFIMFVGWTFGVFYQITKIESSIKSMITKTENALELHINDHKLLNHQIKELQQNRI